MGLPSVLLPLFAPWADLCLYTVSNLPVCLLKQAQSQASACLQRRNPHCVVSNIKLEPSLPLSFWLGLSWWAWLQWHRSARRGAHRESEGKIPVLDVCQEYVCLTTVPELSLPMPARLRVVFYCTLLCLAKASCIHLGAGVLTVFASLL